jgi:hypothetical protein
MNSPSRAADLCFMSQPFMVLACRLGVEPPPGWRWWWLELEEQPVRAAAWLDPVVALIEDGTGWDRVADALSASSRLVESIEGAASRCAWRPRALRITRRCAITGAEVRRLAPIFPRWVVVAVEELVACIQGEST